VTDAFVDAHRVRPLEFNISSPYTPISIRDQMIRAKMLVDRLIESSRLLSTERPLFVVGGGAAGMTAALEAASLGVPVTVIEKAVAPFGMQRRCMSRWVDPVQYDWPANHWAKGVFPWRAPSMPLPWSANVANYLAGVWIAEISKAQKKWPHLKTSYSSHIISATLDRTSAMLEITYADAISGLTTLSCGAAIYAVGYGQEVCNIGDFHGPQFWETDNLEYPLLDCDPQLDGRRLFVKICGGGDGALQDFLRVCTGLSSARAILERVGVYPLEGFLLELFSEEDQARRSSVWNSRLQDHEVQRRLQRVHNRLANLALLNPQIQQALHGLLQPRLDSLDVEIIHSCDHFAQAYCLNRFLVTLILNFAQMAGMTAKATGDHTVHEIIGVAHACSKNYRSCYGQEHKVVSKSGARCGTRAEGTTVEQIAEVVVLRLGIDPPPIIKLIHSKKGAISSKHLLPYSAPW
jgi:thioredoxin reductase